MESIDLLKGINKQLLIDVADMWIYLIILALIPTLSLLPVFILEYFVW